MKLSASEFTQWSNKAITLLGMSGIGKTTLANKLPKSKWFHYSGDYRIGTKYLEEPILDNIKERAMEVVFLKDLLKTDPVWRARLSSYKSKSPNQQAHHQVHKLTHKHGY